LEHGGEVEFSPRNFGILMHRLFAEATNRRELDEALDRMRQEASISAQEATELKRRIEQTLSDPRVASWYDESWDRVLSERDIIRPREAKEEVEIRRPDRVMIKGKRAVVVDYKFGEQQAKQNKKQLAEYIALLRGMGYEEVEGWLWYVRQGRCEQVVG
jgi:ATP-dependent exoDNAse (exonuclease V) beta subunit